MHCHRNWGNGYDALGMPPPPRTGGPPVTNVRNTSSPHLLIGNLTCIAFGET
jgi:hypothetical protein